jgi:hypothetical protein
MSCAIKQCYVVEAPHLSKPWVLETEDVQGKTFVRLNKWDYGFCRFSSHRSLNFKKGTHEDVNLGIVDRLIQLRNLATDKLFAETTQPDEEGPKKKKRAYVRVAKAADLVFLPEIVDIDLPSMKTDTSEVIDGYRTQALTKGVRTSTLYLELSVKNLEYIHNCAVQTRTRGRHHRKQPPGQPADEGCEKDVDAASPEAFS